MTWTDKALLNHLYADLVHDLDEDKDLEAHLERRDGQVRIAVYGEWRRDVHQPAE